jgi:glutamate-1-semialdehyde aminotransferase
MPPRSSAVHTPLPGPRARQLIDRGSFDLQNVYRSAIFDDVASHGTTLVDVDGNSFLDLFSSFALGALGYAPGSRDDAALVTLTAAYCLLPCALKLLAATLLYTLIIRRPP